MHERVSAELDMERLCFRRTPLAAATLWFALGILAARVQLEEPVQLTASLAGCMALALLAMRSTPRFSWVPVAATWIVLGAAAMSWQPPPPQTAELLPYADGLSRAVQARVVRVQPGSDSSASPESTDADPIAPWEAVEDTSEQKGRPLTLDLAIDKIEEVTPDVSRMVPVAGGVRVSVYGAKAHWQPRCGDRLDVPLRLKPVERFRTAGAFQYADYLQGQGIAAHASVVGSRIAPLGPSPPGLRCRLYEAQSWASGRLLAYAASSDNQRLPRVLRLGTQEARMLNAMLFGDRSGLNHALRTGFERTGTFHLFVVSGLHIALVAAAVFWLTGRLRAPPWLQTLTTLAGTTAYAALTGFGQPAQRALAMTAVFLIARLFTRDRDPLNALGAAILAMLVLAPSSLFDASFQMTVLVILAIAGIAAPMTQHTPIRLASVARLVFVRPRRVFRSPDAQLILMLELWGGALAGVCGRWSRRLPAWSLRLLLRASELVLISLVAELVMVLPMAVYFHRLPLFSVPANLMVLPLIGVLVPVAILTFVSSLLSAKLALVPASLTALLLHGIGWFIQRLSGLRAADVRVPAPVLAIALGAAGAWLGCTWLVRRSRMGAGLAALALPVIAAAILWPEPPLTVPGELELTAIDVGQGDSLLVVNPDGRTMLIDAGGPVGSHGVAEASSSFDIGEEVVAPYLWTRRLRRLDVLVLSHAHTDHMGGMPALLEDLRPRELWVGIDPASKLYAALLAQAASLGIPVHHLHAGDGENWGPVRIDVLAPAAAYRNPAAPRNDDSLVLNLTYGRASMLLEGDAERSSEDAMLAEGRVTPVTLLKVGHHGSKTSSNPEFLAVARPRYAVISVGRGNSFGHPRGEVIERFAEDRTALFRTDMLGSITFLLNPDGALTTASASAPLY